MTQFQNPSDFGQSPNNKPDRPQPAPNRSSRLPGILISVIVVLMILGQLGRMGRERQEQRKQNEAVIAEMKSEGDRMRQEAIAQLESGEVGDMTAQLQRAVQVMRQSASRLQGDEQKLVSVMADAYDRIVACGPDYDRTWNVVIDAGGIDAGTFDAQETIAERIAAIETAQDASERLRGAVAGYLPDVRSRIAALDNGQRILREAEQGLQQAGSQIGKLERVINYDVQLATAMIDSLTLLHQEWGKWSYDVASEVIHFESDQTANENNRLVDRIDQLVIEQTEAQRQLLNPR